MLDFEFYNPTRIVFGTHTIAQLPKLLPSTAKRILILFGGSSAVKNGTIAEVKAAISAYTCFEFSGIEPNPSIETLMRAVTLIQQEKIDFLLAVGGGSVIDGTKFVAAAARYEGEPWEILLSGGGKIKDAMPFGSVLTLPATASEMNNGGVITRKATHEKLPFRSQHVFPCFSILDPSKTHTLPERQLANGVVDAFVHITEQYITYPVNGMVQDRFSEGLLQTLIEVGPRAMSSPVDNDARANLMWAATLGLNGLIGAGVPQDWATHMIGHELTALHGIDHARTLAIVLPALLTVRREAKRAKLLQYATRVWGITEGTEEQRIDAAIGKTRDFFESLGIPTRLSAYSIGRDAIDIIVKQLQTHGMTRLGEKQEITPEVSRAILEHAL